LQERVMRYEVKNYPTTEQWLMIQADIRNIDCVLNPSFEIQKYVIQTFPRLYFYIREPSQQITDWYYLKFHPSGKENQFI
jgi:hypothetical protein